MSKFRNWYTRNQDAISWWVIGWCSFACIDNLVSGNYWFALAMAVLVWGNYKLAQIRLS